MRFISKFPLAAFTAIFLSQSAAAQYCADPTANPCLQAKQQNPLNAYVISVYGPSACDDEINTAATTWTAAGSKFELADYSYSGDYYRVVGTSGFQILFNTASEMGAYGVDNAVTYYGRSVAGWTRSDGVVIPVVDDADTIVNLDRYNAGTIECSPTVYTTKYDLTRTMAHEFGHAVGLNHNTITACATYKQGQYVAFSTLCPAEKTASVTLYGVK